MKISIRKIAFSAVIAAVYAALTILLAPISYGPVQFRISEALTILPFFFPSSVYGLFIGCVISNIFSSYGIIDIVFGSLATLLAAVATMYIGKAGKRGPVICAAGCFPPVFFNGVVVGAVIAASTAAGKAFWAAFAVNGLQVAFGELVVMYVIGLPLAVYFPKTKLYLSLKKIYDGDKVHKEDFK